LKKEREDLTRQEGKAGVVWKCIRLPERMGGGRVKKNVGLRDPFPIEGGR